MATQSQPLPPLAKFSQRTINDREKLWKVKPCGHSDKKLTAKLRIL